ncbi:MAG: aminotransferase [Sphingosinicella sp.]|nr:aminotransferase [Sphingosinicella sp.]
MNPLFATLPTSIFEHMSGLARDHDAVNLGQGFPDFGWPDDVVDFAADALRTGSNQYAPMRGLPVLRQAVADHYTRHQNVRTSADEVIVTSGATEALASSILAMVAPGDEVLLIQPLYDAYVPMVRRAGGIPRFMSLTPPDWRLTEEALSAAFTDRTKLVIFCNPHNPTGRMFGADELELLAEACLRHGVIALSDEVWEHVIFDGRRHIPLSSFPGMRDRTVKIGSAGKIFSMTGWKIGWIVAPETLAVPISKAHQFLTFASAPNLQAAAAYGLGKEDMYFETMRANFQQARDTTIAGLGEAGFVALPAEGTYFLSIDLAASGIAASDRDFCERAVREAGVAAIPMSAFYDEGAEGNVVRLCFAKQPETIRAGIEGLRTAKALWKAGS